MSHKKARDNIKGKITYFVKDLILSIKKREIDKFVRIEDVGEYKVAVMQRRYTDCPLPDIYKLDEKSLRRQIIRLKRKGLPYDQSKAALKTLMAVIAAK